MGGIDLSEMKKRDRKILISDLSNKTGLKLNYSNNTGLLSIIGKRKLKQDEKISSTAADDLCYAISDCKRTISVKYLEGILQVDAIGGNMIFFDGENIDQLQNSTKLDKDGDNITGTMGYALSFFHELGHTSGAKGGFRIDEEDGVSSIRERRFKNPIGGNVAYLNIIRDELGLAKRAQYSPFRVDMGDGTIKEVIPFSQSALQQLRAHTNKKTGTTSRSGLPSSIHDKYIITGIF